MAVPLGAVPASLACPTCHGGDVTVAVQGPTYPVHWCGACHTYFCCPPAQATIAQATLSPAPLAEADAAFSGNPSGSVALTPGQAPSGPVWRRAFGGAHAALGWVDARWQISIMDADDRSVILTTAEGTLADAQAKAERLVGFQPTGPWLVGSRASG